MTTPTSVTQPGTQPAPEPTQGGSYQRCPHTGELTPDTATAPQAEEN